MHPFKGYGSMGISQLCHHHHSFILEHSHHPKMNPPVPLSSHSLLPASPSPWQPLVCFLSLWLCLFWTFHINGITQYVAFCVWLLALSMFSRAIHGVACAHVSLLFRPEFSLKSHPTESTCDLQVCVGVARGGGGG